MDWSNERYVRVYTRDTPDWTFLSWEAQALFLLMMRKVDRSGVLETKRGRRGLAALLSMPVEVVDRAMNELIEDGCVEEHGLKFVITNFIEAQEATMSPAARQRESRERRRDAIRNGMDPAKREAVIYFIQSEHGGPVKIGYADDVAKRLVQLQTSRPDKLVLLASQRGTPELERELHRRFADVREKGEWFTATDELMAYIRSIGCDQSSDESRIVTSHERVTGHETSPVTPIRSEPIRSDSEKNTPRAREASRPPVAARAALVRALWAEHLRVFNAAREQHEPDVPELVDRPGAEGERLLSEAVKAHAEEFGGDLTRVERLLRHCLAVAEAEAGRDRSVRYLGEKLWTPTSIASLRTRSVTDARAGPRRGAPRRQSALGALLDDLGEP